MKLVRKFILVLLMLLLVASGYFFYVAEYRQTANNKNYSNASNAVKSLVNEYQSFAKNSSKIVSITNDNLKLHAEYVSAKNKTNKTVIVIHGFRRNLTGMKDYSAVFLKQGYNVLNIDNRGHGKSEGNFVGFGWLDKNDVLKWIDYLIKQNPNVEIVPFGISMGGATVTMLSGEKLPSNVKAIIEDSAYTTADEEITYQAKEMFNLPKFPFVDLVSLESKIIAGYSFKEADAVKSVKKNKLPMLFMHGGDDTYVPTYMVNILFKADPDSRKQLWIAPNSEHVDSLKDHTQEYESHVKDFLDQYFK
jgi:fermentation-respiration switch protein FrsA (DUF1100 family)